MPTFESVSCSAASAHVPDIVKQKRESFSFVEVNSLAVPKSCKHIGPTKQALEEEDCDISHLKPLPLRSFGSGTVVRHVINHTYVLTAAHDCWVPETDSKDNGKKVVEVSIKTLITVTNGKGKRFNAEIYAMDTKNDLCVLKAEGIFGEPVPVSKKPPEFPEEVYTFGAPLAIHHPNVILFFKGHTAGSHFHKAIERKVSFYTLVARPGSSGSSVLNKSGEIVGVIHTAINKIETVAIGASLRSIQDILGSIPEVRYERVD